MGRKVSFRCIIETEQGEVALEYAKQAESDPRVRATELRTRTVKEQRK